MKDQRRQGRYQPLEFCPWGYPDHHLSPPPLGVKWHDKIGRIFSNSNVFHMFPIFFVFFETGGGGRAKPNKKLPTPFLLGHLEKDMKDKKDREDTSLLNFLLRVP